MKKYILATALLASSSAMAGSHDCGPLIDKDENVIDSTTTYSVEIEKGTVKLRTVRGPKEVGNGLNAPLLTEMERLSSDDDDVATYWGGGFTVNIVKASDSYNTITLSNQQGHTTCD